MQVVVEVRGDVARSLREGDVVSLEAEEIREVNRRLGVQLHEMHPDVEDASLEGFFNVDVPDRQAAETVARELGACGGVLGAYAKPPDEVP